MGTIKYTAPEIGDILISAKDGCITGLYFHGNGDTSQNAHTPQSQVLLEKIHEQSTPEDVAVLQSVSKELDAYFAGSLREFSVPLKPEGTDFRKKVWTALQTIPYGETISYKTLAQRINNPKAIRAVGGANHHNPISIIIPCHRVIGANGKLVGYGGGMDVKRFLLALERGM